MTKILDGKAIAAEMREEIKVDVARLAKQGTVPGLAVLLVGDDPASRSYVSVKEKACADVGISASEVHLPAGASREDILDAVHSFNNDNHIHGILVQLPLPDSGMEQDVISAVNPDKDVDGLHPVNVGRMILGLPAFRPCTPHGVLHMLKRSGISTQGAHVLVIGRSNLVGRPVANMLTQKTEMGNATVTLCHTGTKDLARFTRDADIIIAAVGRPNTVTADMVRAGAVIIDVGVNRIDDPTAKNKKGYRLVGDVAYDELAEKASAITPVPGGVGPMTVTMLLYNTVRSAERTCDPDR